MDRVNRIGASGGHTFDTFARRADRPSDTRDVGRALVAVQPIKYSEPSPALSRLPAAAFLAHLIATERMEPQTRQQRRAEPSDARDAYAVRTSVTSGRLFSRLS
jgi:hypothetical protein